MKIVMLFLLALMGAGPATQPTSRPSDDLRRINQTLARENDKLRLERAELVNTVDLLRRKITRMQTELDHYETSEKGVVVYTLAGKIQRGMTTKTILSIVGRAPELTKFGENDSGVMGWNFEDGDYVWTLSIQMRLDSVEAVEVTKRRVGLADKGTER